MNNELDAVRAYHEKKNESLYSVSAFSVVQLADAAIAACLQEIDRLAYENKSLQLRLESAEKDAREWADSFKMAEKSLAEAIDDRDNYRNLATSLNEQLTQAESHAADCKRLVTVCEDEITDLKYELLQAEERVREQTEKTIAARQETHLAIIKRREAEEQMRVAAGQADILRFALDRANKSSEHWADRAQKAEAVLADAAIAALEERVRELEAALESSVAEADLFQRQLLTAKEWSEVYRTRCEIAESEIEELRKFIEEGCTCEKKRA